MKHFTRAVLLCFLFFIQGLTVYGQTANFTEDYISGCAPLVVHFTNTSTGATSYNWNLGNGTTTPGPDASTSYLTPGTYTVTLTAYNGSSSSTHTITITVYPTPTVNFYADDTSVCPGVPVTFTSTTSSGVAGALTYMWNFGDGSSSTDAGPSHTFPGPGYYNITLAATNIQGCVSSLTKGAYIHVFTPATPSFTASNTYICQAPGAVTFTNGTTGTGPFTYTWSFGDGATSGLTGPSHNYTATGSYTVKLVVTDGNGCTDSLIDPAYVYVGNLTAAFAGPATACVNTDVLFANTSSPHLSSVWTFGDGATSTADTGHTYTTAGTYTVTLVVFDGICHDTVSHVITILPGATASFTMSPLNSCPAPAAITFTASVPTGATVIWKYGDGASGSGTPATHTYAHNGPDTVSMIVTSSSGCKDTIKEVYELYNLRIDINHDTIASGCVPLSVRFTCHTWTTVPDSAAYHAYPFGISSYTWNFGDGSATVSGSYTTVHTYTAVGIYTCAVYIVTGNGCLDTAYLSVLVGTPPHASFTAMPTHICAGQAVVFDNTSTGATGYLWLFGDNTSSVATDPTHIYTLPGIFSDTLIAYYNGCPDTFVRTDYVTVDSPAARIIANYFCDPRNEVSFIDTSLGDNSHLWIFGDGTTSTAKDTVHFYPAYSTYTVTLTTYNIASGCRDTMRLPVDLRKPTISFTASDTAVCRDAWIDFTAIVTGDSTLAYYWYRDGALRAGDTTGFYTDTFHIRGQHTIMLAVKDSHDCMDTLTKTNYITVAKPIADFTALPPSGCEPLIVDFVDHSTDVTGTTLTNYTWTFGDGSTLSASTTPTLHTYTAVGTYSVREVVTDNLGCKDTITVPNMISVYKLHASFYASNLHPCPWDIVSFYNTSASITGAFWSFGDGTTSTVLSPMHAYTAAGTYTVMLVVTDAHGCTDTSKLVNYITITAPVAAFTESDSFSICAPLSVSFFNGSTGAISYSWTFGDGNSSVAISPGDLYITPGYYTVVLVASNAYGCKDTATRHINIYGYTGAFTYNPDTGCAPLTVYFHAAITNVPSIIWDFGDGSTSSASSTADTVHTYSIPGGYVPKLILSDNTGCQNSSRGIDTIKVDAVKTGFKTSAACVGLPFNFIDTSTSYWTTVTTWQWSFGGSTATIAAPAAMYSVAGTYTVTLVATDAWGCKDSATQQIIVHPLPQITASADTIICAGDHATLTAQGGVGYSWAPPATLSCVACDPTIATPTVVTTYTVTGTDTNGCRNTDTVMVSLKTQTTSVARGDTAVCRGTKVTISDSGATKFTWMPPGGLSSTTIADPIADPATTTTYTVIAQQGSCAPDINYVTIVVYPLPTVDAGPDQTLIAGSIAQLQATGTDIATYSWTPALTLSCDDCPNPVASMSVTTTYVVDVTSPHNCLASDSVTIHLYCNTSQVFIPNSFTPNGDGENDVFYPRGTGISAIKSFRIYNRWGELLFERDNIQINDAANAWDGTFAGGTPRPDVYVYVVDAICETGEPVFIKGDVTIIR